MVGVIEAKARSPATHLDHARKALVRVDQHGHVIVLGRIGRLFRRQWLKQWRLHLRFTQG